MLLKELVLLLRNYNVFLLNNPLRMSFKGCIPGSEDENSFFYHTYSIFGAFFWNAVYTYQNLQQVSLTDCQKKAWILFYVFCCQIDVKSK